MRNALPVLSEGRRNRTYPLLVAAVVLAFVCIGWTAVALAMIVLGAWNG